MGADEPHIFGAGSLAVREGPFAPASGDAGALGILEECTSVDQNSR